MITTVTTLVAGVGFVLLADLDELKELGEIDELVNIELEIWLTVVITVLVIVGPASVI